MEVKSPGKVIAVLDLPPRRALKNVRESYAAAADRWGAELLWIRQNLKPVHPFWQKMFVCRHVHETFGSSHVLQLDNDMVIRSDCPSPFDLVKPKQFGIVAERQCAQNRIDNGGWQKKAHDVWAERCGLEPALTWLHPNGGLYLYETEMFGPMFDRIIAHMMKCWGAHDQATDESLIINQLWNDHPGYIAFLPGEFNTSVQQAADWAPNPVMQSCVYHFIGKSKPFLNKCRWRRFADPELPYPNHAPSQQVINNIGNNPPAEYDIGPIFTPELAANLLAAYPKLIVTGEWSNEPHRLDPRMLSHAETASTHLVLTRFFLRLGVNASRFRLRIKEDAVDGSTLAVAGT
ncbi:hypothetical protein LF1_06910 [Rubripirellula obstinata]|uniref:Glycosyl transferase family 8 n=1 Tax=Rubripirellula obstinata TaxID=406547 RepID=A0A5B1CE86_9BACT|nr:hypothetical protein [Rubripirellula obstinata]KAA1258175.1 hypothetical protein LF1_06910 [Rubripirellula obstinata]